MRLRVLRTGCSSFAPQGPSSSQGRKSHRGGLARGCPDAERRAALCLNRRSSQGSPDARELWAEIYGPLSDGKPRTVGAVTSRAEAEVMRSLRSMPAETNPRRFRSSTSSGEGGLGLLRRVGPIHLRRPLGDETADVILARLRDAGDEGLHADRYEQGVQGPQASGRHRSGTCPSCIARAGAKRTCAHGWPSDRELGRTREQTPKKAKKAEGAPYFA